MNLNLNATITDLVQSKQDVKRIQAKFENFRETDQKSLKETNTKTQKYIKEIRDRLKKAEAVGTNSMSVIQKVDDKYSKANISLK